MNNLPIQELKSRWLSILRHKASEYEHTARGKGKKVTQPDLDTICGEIEAFFAGLEITNKRGINEKDLFKMRNRQVV